MAGRKGRRRANAPRRRRRIVQPRLSKRNHTGGIKPRRLNPDPPAMNPSPMRMATVRFRLFNGTPGFTPGNTVQEANITIAANTFVYTITSDILEAMIAAQVLGLKPSDLVPASMEYGVRRADWWANDQSTVAYITWLSTSPLYPRKTVRDFAGKMQKARCGLELPQTMWLIDNVASINLLQVGVSSSNANTVGYGIIHVAVQVNGTVSLLAEGNSAACSSSG